MQIYHVCRGRLIYRGENGYIHKEKKLSYSNLQGIWAFIQNMGCAKKIFFSYAVFIKIHMLNVVCLSKDVSGLKKEKRGSRKPWKYSSG